MKALVYQEPWKMTMQDLPKPVLQPGEVLVKMESVGICGSDVHGFTGESGRRAPGMVMGHEIVGKIEEIAAEITSLQVGQRVPVPNYDYARSCRTEKVDWVEPCSVLLLDGLHLYYKESIRNLFSLKIFVDTPLPLCEQRRVERDVLERGQSEEVVREQYKNNVIPMYEAFIKPVMDRADMVVSGDHEASVNIRLLWQRLAPLLNQ